MTRLLDRYVFRELLPPFLLGVGLFTFFLTIDRIYSLTDLVVTKGVPFHLVLQLLVYMLPSFLAHGVTILEIDRNYRLLHRLDTGRAHWTDEAAAENHADER